MNLKRITFSQIELAVALGIAGALVVLAASVMLGASEDAKETALARNLRTIRCQIEVFRGQHGGLLPGRGGNCIEGQLVRKTDLKGRLDADGPCGPYFCEFPANPFTDTNTVQSGTGGPGGGDHGWYYNTQTGKLSPDDDKHKNM